MRSMRSAGWPGFVVPRSSWTTTSRPTRSTEGVAARAGFVESFDGLAEAELDTLRNDFVRKAVLAGTDRVCRPLLAAGRTRRRARRADPGRRAAVGRPDPTAANDEPSWACRPGRDSPLLVDAVTGEAVASQALPLHLRRARLTRVNIEANAGVCRGMLQHRYGTRGQGEMEEVR